MTYVRTAATRFVAVLTIAGAGLVSAHAISSAEPARQVRYTVTTTMAATVNLNYVATEPESQAAFEADPNAYLRNERVSIAPGAPWVFETTLNDTSWAYVMAGGAARYSGSPNPHCDIAIDGQVVVQQGSETGAMCALRAW